MMAGVVTTPQGAADDEMPAPVAGGASCMLGPLDAAQAAMSIDELPADPPMMRATATYKDCCERFRLRRGKDEYKRQYSHLYYARLRLLKERVVAAAHRKWDHLQPAPKYVDSILKTRAGERCFVVGTLFKDMKAKPSVLDEHHAREHYEAPPPERSKYVEEDDELVLEDHTGRMVLTGAALAKGNLVTGIVVGVLGEENASGEFEVVSYTSVDEMPQKPIECKDDVYVAMISGLHVSADNKNTMLALQLFVDWLTGQAAGGPEQELASKVARLVVAGNMIGETENSLQGQAKYKTKNAVADSVVHMDELDHILRQLAASLPVDIMAGPNDPSNHTVPQQPLHACMFPFAAELSTLHALTNPSQFEVGGTVFLGSSGQGVDDIYRFSASENRLDMLEDTLSWGHIFPTAPDTLACFPFHDKDPFVIDTCPHVFFAGNQPTYASRVHTGYDGQRTRCILVPNFAETGTVVLVNISTLQCHPINFATFSDGAAAHTGAAPMSS